MNKWSCSECQLMAVWYYLPYSADKIETNSYFCDTHIQRGCSCNEDPETGLQDTDKQNRLLPCCEYIFEEEGFDNKPAKPII